MASENETVAEIVHEMNCSHEGMIAFEFQHYASRIEAAHKREIAAKNAEIARLRRPTPVDDDLLKMARDIEKLNAKLKVAEDALQKIFNKVFVDCIVAEIANDALAAIRGERDNNENK